jgi:hypothetical protein
MDMAAAPAAAMPFLELDLGYKYEYDEPQWQYSVAGRTLTSATIGVLQDHVCLETPQGWMLALHPYTLRAFLWRPDDGERIALPDMTESFPMNCKCVLSDKPGGGGFCAVMVFDLNKSKFEYWLCAVGGSKWERHGYELTMYNAEDQPVVRHMARRNGMAAVRGKVYYEFTGNELGFVEFDPADPDEPILGMSDVDMVDTDSFLFRSCYLVESHGELFLVAIFFDGPDVDKIAEVAVYRMDFSAPAWCKVDGIGSDRVFLLGGDRIGVSNFGASCAAAAERGLTGNCIYFLNHLAYNECFLHVIGLENGTEEVLRPFEDFPYTLRPPVWMFPTEP